MEPPFLPLASYTTTILVTSPALLPHAHAQRGKVIVSVVVVVVVSTKIARSRILGEFASATLLKMVHLKHACFSTFHA